MRQDDTREQTLKNRFLFEVLTNLFILTYNVPSKALAVEFSSASWALIAGLQRKRLGRFRFPLLLSNLEAI